MNFADAAAQLGAPRTFADAIDTFRDRGSRWLADTFHIPMRTAQYWLSGRRDPTRSTNPAVRARGLAVMRAVDRQARQLAAARRLRSARTLTVGRVRVAAKSSGRPQGTRTVGTVAVDAEARRELDAVADAIEAGDISAADDRFSECVLGLYGMASRPPNRDKIREWLYVYDYRDGIRAG